MTLMPKADHRGRPILSEWVCLASAGALITLGLFLLLRHPTVTFTGHANPAPLRGRCASVKNAAFGDGGTLDDDGHGTWLYSYQYGSDVDALSSKSKILAEIDCDRIRTRDAVFSAVLTSPVILLLRFVLFGHRDSRNRRILGALVEHVGALQRRLDQ